VSKDKLDALGELLGVSDDTREGERPTTGRGLSDVLGAKLIEDKSPIVAERRVDDGSPKEQPQTSTTSRELRPELATHRPERKTPTTPRPAPTKAALRRRTSSTIPVDVVVRLRAAKHKRWDIARLLQDSVALCEAGELSENDAEMFLDQTMNDTKATESFQLAEDDLEAIDELGRRWRMNRSQIVSVLLDRQLTVLGF
jgi:hypothetical protein